MADAYPPLETLPDPFDDLLNLEQRYHTEGYALGVADGSRAGRIEGRVFGLEKGFEKFSALGRLGGRSAVWNARLPPSASVGSGTPLDDESSGAESGGGHSLKVGALDGSDRLRKHVKRLRDLTDPETSSTENSEDAVSEYDDRLKDAKAKATLISRMVGENDERVVTSSEGRKDKAGNEMEDFDRIVLRGARKEREQR